MSQPTTVIDYERHGGRGGRRPAFAFIVVTLLIDILGIGLIIPVLPKLVTQMAGGSESSSATVYGFFVAVYAANQFLFAPLLGALSDRFGRRPVLLISIFGTACDYVLMTFAPSLTLLFVGRVLNGVTAANISTCNAYVADVTPAADRPKRFGMLGAVFGIGFVLGPFLGGVLGEHNLRTPFAFAACLAFANFFYGLLVLPESLPRELRSAFSWQKANPLKTLTTLKQFHGVWPIATVLFLANFAQFSLHSIWVLYTGYKFGWTPSQVGLSLVCVGVFSAAVQGGLSGRVVKKLGLYKTLYLGLLFSAVAFACYGLASQGWMLYPAIFISSIGGLVGPAAQSVVTKRVGPSNQGLAQGALSSLSALAAVFAPLIATRLFATFSGPHAVANIPGIPFFMGAGCILGASVLAIFTLRDSDAPETIQVASN